MGGLHGKSRAIPAEGGTAVADLTTAFDIIRSQPTAMSPPCSGRCASCATVSSPPPPRPSARVIALIVARILAPGSKLAIARGLAADTARDSLAEALGIGTVDEDKLYAAMDWLLERQGVIEHCHRDATGATWCGIKRPEGVGQRLKFRSATQPSPVPRKPTG